MFTRPVTKHTGAYCETTSPNERNKTKMYENARAHVDALGGGLVEIGFNLIKTDSASVRYNTPLGFRCLSFPRHMHTIAT